MTVESDVLRLYYNRLVVNVCRNNITFFADIRDREKWTKEMLKYRETTTLEELPEEHAFGRIHGYFVQHGVNRIDQYRILQKLFPLDVVKRYCKYIKQLEVTASATH